MQTLDVAWNARTLNYVLESHFVHDTLLADPRWRLSVQVAHEGQPFLAPPRMLLVSLRDEWWGQLERLKQRGHRVALLHLGDEHCSDARDAYAHVELVLRPYYTPEAHADALSRVPTVWVPFGYRTGIGPRRADSLKPVALRRNLAAFIGWLDNGAAHGNERADFAAAGAECGGDCVLYATAGFSRGWQPGMYAAMMEDCVFAPCPAGNAPETLRLYDALELGCIPISRPHAFLLDAAAMGGVPFPLLDDWSELPAMLAEFRRQRAEEPARIEALQREVYQWWQAKKRELAARGRQALAQWLAATEGA
ncbi:hypothetical protein [Chitinimonas koreensis]|uniref:hypothetical protein n=1 Tax=Chitinimonas koreensis TaxID=356302 RepID=UPI0003F6D1E5|nr:hypothetical protein [Chitinimonas koreensis]QNM96175.1 hypothetical protein H9L41_20580 [Chitinimonas koreensis]